MGKATFKSGDRIQIISPYGTYTSTYRGIHSMCYGIVEYASHSNCIAVSLDNKRNAASSYGRYYFKPEELKLIEKNYEGENLNMVGNYEIAGVRFLTETNKTKEYFFALFDETVQIDDIVLCDTEYGHHTARVNSIKRKEDINFAVTKEIICKVDLSEYEDRKKKRELAVQLKTKMDKRVKELQGIALFEMMAEKDDSLKEMLGEYKSLVG